MRTVLFLCVENSFRSQIAEAYFNKYAPQGWKAESAGVKPAERVHPNAVKLMLEEGIDISHKKPRRITAKLEAEADVTVIVCSGSQCPVVHAKHLEEWNIPDPAEMPLDEARKIRDVIRGKVLDLVERIRRNELPGKSGGRATLTLKLAPSLHGQPSPTKPQTKSPEEERPTVRNKQL